MTDKKEEAPYGYCPICGVPGFSREKRPNGNDTCYQNHTYPSYSAMIQLDNTKPKPACARKLNADNFMGTVAANVVNPRMTDKEFREFILDNIGEVKYYGCESIEERFNIVEEANKVKQSKNDTGGMI